MSKVLLIEDAPEMQRLYQLGLQKEGYEVEVVGSAGEGLTRVSSGVTYDVILLDLMLMGMSGLDFLEQSKIHQVSPGTKVIVLTNIDNPEVVERVKAQGVDDYLLKSETEPKKLAEIIRKLQASGTVASGAPAVPSDAAPAGSSLPPSAPSQPPATPPTPAA